MRAFKSLTVVKNRTGNQFQEFPFFVFFHMPYAIQWFRLLEFLFKPLYGHQAHWGVFSYSILPWRLRGITESFKSTYMDRWWQACPGLTLTSFWLGGRSQVLPPLPEPCAVMTRPPSTRRQLSSVTALLPAGVMRDSSQDNDHTEHAPFLMSRKAMKMCFITNFWQDVISETASCRPGAFFFLFLFLSVWISNANSSFWVCFLCV